MLQRLDVETQRGRYGVNCVPVEFFQDGGFARIVQAPAEEWVKGDAT